MIVPTLNPYVVSLIALSQPAVLAPTPPTQAVTKRPAMPSGKGEKADPRAKGDRDPPEKSGRGRSTDFVV
jgi:hypothetical protein